MTRGLASALAAAPILPSDPGRRALVLFLAGDDRSEPAPDPAVLAATLATSGPVARATIVARARASGRSESIRALARRHRGAVGLDGSSDAEWSARVAALATRERGEELWRLVPEARRTRCEPAKRL